MHLGGYTLHLLDTGRFHLDGGAMFGIVPRALWGRRIEPDAQNRIPMAARCLLLEGHGRLVLVDTGVGDKQDAKFASIYGVDTSGADIVRSLKAAGFAPEEVTDVILTHLHFDHAGGATVRAPEGGLALRFPNARHHVQAAHWAWAHQSPREGASFLPENLDPLEASGTLVLADGPGELLPNLDLVVVDGHTRGQQLVKITGQSDTLLYAADLLPTAHHVPLLWVMAYDIEPLQTLAEKEPILAEAAANDWLVVFEHDAHTAAARIEAGPRGFHAVDARPHLTAEPVG